VLVILVSLISVIPSTLVYQKYADASEKLSRFQMVPSILSLDRAFADGGISHFRTLWMC
jgi:hypothetical protein